MNDAPDPELPEPANLRFLRLLVTTLTGVMIVGLLTIIGLFVMRFSGGPHPLTLPDAIVLPEGARAEAVTFTESRILVVSGETLLVYSPNGDLVQTLVLDTP